MITDPYESLILAAGDRFSFRPDELKALQLAALAYENDNLMASMSGLLARIEALESK
ncbi:hypothetical protein D9M71_837090 [compost metagenome]